MSVWEEVWALRLHVALVEAVKAVDIPDLQFPHGKILQFGYKDTTALSATTQLVE